MRLQCMHQSWAGEVLAFSLHEAHTSSDGMGGFSACVQPLAEFQATGIAPARRLVIPVAEQRAEPTALVLLPQPSWCASQLPKLNLIITVLCLTMSLPRVFSETGPA